MAPYEYLRQAGIKEGEQYSFTRRQVTPEGVVDTTETQNVERITGGGFFGSVVILPDSVIKTTTPDNLHELLRRINWHTPFPSRTNETAAELDYLAGRIIHRATPPLTRNTIITPDALGYSQPNPKIGFAQHIERMRGRGPTFKDKGKENRQIRAARQTLWDLASELGAEHAAQVHPENPFGKPNLWVSETGQVIWLDYLPAFRHTGRVRPFFRFPFHNEVQQAFGSDKPTYNRLHTDILRRTILAQKERFPAEDLKTIDDLLSLYDERWQQYEAWLNHDPRELFIADALNRGLISNEYADRLRALNSSYQFYQTKEIARLGLHVFLDKVKESPLRIFWDKEFQHKVVKFGLNPEYRRQQVLEHTTLWGMKQAHDQGLVSDEEFNQALSFVPEHELRLYVGLQTWYFLNSRLIDAVTIPLAAAVAVSEHPIEAATAVSAFNFFAPGIIRALSTVIVSKLSGVELKRAALISAIPIVGNYSAIALQLRSAYGEKAADIEHYTMRALVATLSKIRPWGGWNSDLEEKIWDFVHRGSNLE
ncbi:hypothetical protein A3C25_04900 [Candidatus Roizmanbacteria bacterium RIFCSPHIGHO2_02_FULL_38_11]|uniref:Uncharacterized protein n=1 Tax=Candidatus Roizmanbacteria bacterium RIFCSPHIGHO2_02_FULL_38_11 TaxID=1802039 RepID=A0A1F7GZM3_9BACT|nr:MAG: hypothetical protein A3C25_04900 [Candidatus Roizmanbacteria bacterium RIFCSPHIGHO2_02_FULL_38_11]